MGDPNSLPTEKRSYDRNSLSGGASFVLDDQSHDCSLNNISIGGAALTSSVKPEPETRLTLMIEGLDPLPARVTRVLVEGFAVEFEIPAEDWERVTDQLLYLADLRQFF